MNMDETIARYKIEDSEKWRDFIKTMPYITFPADWQVAIIPPFGGAIARFRVKLPTGQERSVYFDAYEKLGYYGGEPYWEVYPYQGDIGRCDMDDVSTLLEMIADTSEVSQ